MVRKFDLTEEARKRASDLIPMMWMVSGPERFVRCGYVCDISKQVLQEDENIISNILGSSIIKEVIEHTAIAIQRGGSKIITLQDSVMATEQKFVLDLLCPDVGMVIGKFLIETRIDGVIVAGEEISMHVNILPLVIFNEPTESLEAANEED